MLSSFHLQKNISRRFYPRAFQFSIPLNISPDSALLIMCSSKSGLYTARHLQFRTHGAEVNWISTLLRLCMTKSRWLVCVRSSRCEFHQRQDATAVALIWFAPWSGARGKLIAGGTASSTCSWIELLEPLSHILFYSAIAMTQLLQCCWLLFYEAKEFIFACFHTIPYYGIQTNDLELICTIARTWE
jgi:hypothetical protein